MVDQFDPDEKNLHVGHRERMKQRFLNHGLDTFDDHTVLELLLFYSQPRKDTNPLAHMVLDHFGSLEAVFEAKEEELRQIKGLGENSVVLLKLIPQISRRYMMEKYTNDNILDSAEIAGAYFVPRFMYERTEVVYIACLDAKHRVVCCKEIGRGVVNYAEVSIRRIVEIALGNNAAGVIVAHNHTSGIALPSDEDKLSTNQIKRALRLVGIELIDHIIVGGDDFVSMAESGLL